MPGAWAIINNEDRHGVTIHHMSPGADEGDIAFQTWVDIAPFETGHSLYKKCNEAGAALLRQSLSDIMAGNIPAEPQDSDRAIYYPRAYPYDGVVNWGWEARFVERYVRAMTFPPFPNPFTFVKGLKVHVGSARAIDRDEGGAMQGTVLSYSPLLVQCGRGVVLIDDLSFENCDAAQRISFDQVLRLGT